MTQFFLNGAIKNALTGGVPRELSNSEKIGAAVGSGVLSSVVASPLELMMVQQQVKGTGLLETAVSLIKGGPVLARGMIGMMGREGIFCGCYLGIMPVVRAERRAHATIALVGSHCLAGRLCTGLALECPTRCVPRAAAHASPVPSPV